MVSNAPTTRVSRSPIWAKLSSWRRYSPRSLVGLVLTIPSSIANARSATNSASPIRTICRLVRTFQSTKTEPYRSRIPLTQSLNSPKNSLCRFSASFSGNVNAFIRRNIWRISLRSAFLITSTETVYDQKASCLSSGRSANRMPSSSRAFLPSGNLPSANSTIVLSRCCPSTISRRGFFVPLSMCSWKYTFGKGNSLRIVSIK